MFSKFFIERPRFAAVVSLLLVITGILTMFKLPVAEYPEISPPQIRVSATYSGASAEVMRDTVALVLESEFNGLEDLLYFSSECSNTGSYSCSLRDRNKPRHCHGGGSKRSKAFRSKVAKRSSAHRNRRAQAFGGLAGNVPAADGRFEHVDNAVK